MPHALPPSPFAHLKVWLVHDWLTGMRGGEKVLLELTRLFPNSKIATLFHVPNSTHPDLDSRVARTSFLQNVPHIHRHYRNLLPLMPAAIRSIQLDPCDLVISSSHCVAKGILPPAPLHRRAKSSRKTVPHLCYCHTPMRYIWGLQDHYFSPKTSHPKKLAARLFRDPLRQADLAFNETVTHFVANSHNIADRIRRFYNRPADVIHPGFDETYFTPSSAPRENHYLIVSALVPYKRLDLAIRAFTHSPRPLIIIGKGPEESRLRALAKNAPHISFLGWQSDDQIRHHYQHAQALLFPGEEDFGMVPLEAQACGTPIIAYAQGGALETIIPLPQSSQHSSSPTGLFFEEQTPASLLAALDQFESHRPRFSPAAIRAHALQFTWQHFHHSLTQLTHRLLASH